MLELLIGEWVWEELLAGAGMAGRHHCKAHPHMVRDPGKLQLWRSLLQDLQAAQELRESPLTQLKLFIVSITSGTHPGEACLFQLAKSCDVCLLPQSYEPHLSLAEGMLQFRGNCCIREELSVLRSGFLGV